MNKKEILEKLYTQDNMLEHSTYMCLVEDFIELAEITKSKFTDSNILIEAFDIFVKETMITSQTRH